MRDRLMHFKSFVQKKAEYYDTHFSSMNNEEAQKYLNSIAQIDEQSF